MNLVLEFQKIFQKRFIGILRLRNKVMKTQ